MKPLVGLALLVLVPHQTVKVVRDYKVGDVDAYHITMKMQGAMAMTMSMDSTQKVLKVYDNGDADVESTVSDGKMDMMGMKRSLPSVSPTTTRLTKYGTPVGGVPDAKGKRMQMDFAKYMRQLPKDEMKVGQTVDFNEVESADGKTVAKGTSTLQSVTGGIAKIVTRMDVITEGATKPMHLDFTTLVEAATGRPTHAEGTITNLDGAAGLPKGMPVTSILLTMDRKA